MEFGEWVKTTRKERGLDIRVLAEKAGVDVSTISRIENLHTEATLYTSFRICQFLKISLPELFQIVIDGYSVSLEQKSRLDNETIVRMGDVADFVGSFVYNKLQYCGRIAESLNEISNELKTKQKSGRSFSLFTDRDIEKLLFDTSLYKFELKYPPRMKTDTILYIYKHEGVLILADVTEYLRGIYSEKKVLMKKSEEWSNYSSIKALNRLETSTLERIRLSDVLLLDRQLEQNGKLADMYWMVSSFYDRFSSPRNRQKYKPRELFFDNEETVIDLDEYKFELASIYITISRWYHFLKGANVKWSKLLYY